MKKTKILIPAPRSRFYKVICRTCGAENIVFSHSTFPARCKVCGTQLVQPTGGKARILRDKAEIVAELG
ncbi:30S ribosomal protein S27e [Desulfurococcus amylolyticus]|uniref:Small ribosomal subunit protein eS27 n=1 Tax=Desulfurococcus amylolyticus (strain DSM 18924 / JCM 16383 / VKM B-2413 / 1221n) TaxID=490899 RepID=B8D536_DESA1|nr:30S ribosomal protein S27e [Desulfurococcus amylolyticus]ACL11217.1 30S ribosomal protein S27e [Desulfurococcus amylolyticus 1221n]